MDNQRLLIWAAFGLLLWFTWQTWVRDNSPEPVSPVAPATEETANAPGDDEPAGSPGADEPAGAETLPELPGPAADAPAQAASPQVPAANEAAAEAGRSIHVRTDVLDVRIDTLGGTLWHAELLDYPVHKDHPENLVTLLSRQPAELGLLETGLRSQGEGPEANHLALFQSPQTEYTLGDKDELTVSLTWENGQGVSVVKQYTFERGSYIIGLQQTVTNESGQVWQGAPYVQIKRHSYPQERSMFDVDTYSFHGPLFYDGEKASKLQRDDLLSEGPFTASAEDGWIAMIQHHFLIGVVPTAETEQHYRADVVDDVATASVIGSTQAVPAGDGETFTTALFVGPKLQDQLEQVTPTLKLTVDYGWLTILSEPLFWLLSKINSFVHNWGVAIILVTVMIKLAFYKLTQASGRSMAKMREIQPRMKALQERYKDDRQQLSQAMMELYKREKVNPAAGCLPILIQMPFFLAFYWVLLESVEMRQAPFALWITDLSSRDPYFILPAIMGAAMFLQQKLNPKPADPMQAKVMQLMPIVFTVFFAFFPAGLVLYWVTNTSLSILQQWRINKVVEEESRKRRAGKSPAKKKHEKDKSDAA
ncbi:MAG TPA: membrane protein insertase YidC [Woeseiaceae bacterium]|nr:membrane protein insertase YidC [Woeseiaceae bacterium]